MTYLKKAKELTVKETELPSDIPLLDWQFTNCATGRTRTNTAHEQS